MLDIVPTLRREREPLRVGGGMWGRRKGKVESRMDGTMSSMAIRSGGTSVRLLVQSILSPSKG
jgi:hypothetical protein